MTLVTKILALAVAAAVLAMAPLSAARASERHRAGYVALGLASLALLGTRHALAAGHRDRHVYSSASPRRVRLGRHRQRLRLRQQRRRGPCHTVYKMTYDAYGQPLKVAGTMCYDAFGRSYVVRGSRYVVHRY